MIATESLRFGRLVVLLVSFSLAGEAYGQERPADTPAEVQESGSEPSEEAPVEADGSAEDESSGEGEAESGEAAESTREVTPSLPVPGADEPEDVGREGRGQGDRAAAESLVRVGRGLMELGRYDEACAKLEQSMDASPSGEAALLLGECSERLGRLAAAWAVYRQAAAHFRASGDSRREVALTRARELEPKVPKLTLRAALRLPKMRIQRDDTDFGIGVLGVPLAVDPGPHRLEVRAEGYEPWTMDLELKPSERRTIEIPALQRLAPAEPDSPGSAPARPRGRGPLFYGGVITAGAGAASVAVGALLGASASRDVSAAESSEALCGASRLCTPEGRELVNRADRKAIAATVTLSLGAAAVATGLVLIIADPGESPREGDRATGPRLDLRPMPTRAGGGLALGGRF
jgi:hypothetical protein